MNRSAIIKKTTCNHCGDDCLTEEYSIGEKLFCSPGCKSVYQVLSDNKLSSYYSYNDYPGASQIGKSKQFDHIGHPAAINRLIDYTYQGISIVTLSIPHIHSSSCIWLLEQLNKINPAVHYSRVDFLKKELIVRFDHQKLSLQQLVELLYDIGYEPRINLQETFKKQNGLLMGTPVQKIAVRVLSVLLYFAIS